MCRTTDFHRSLQTRDRNVLKIKAFRVLFSNLRLRESIPGSLTLLYLPRITETELVIDGLNTRPDSSAFLTLHRVVNVGCKEGEEVVFWSKDRVRVSEGVRFEVYLREDRVLEGVFRKGEEEWKLECKCGLESANGVLCGGTNEVAAVVEVEVEGAAVALSEKVEMVVKRDKKNRSGRGFGKLEVIPEEREEVGYDYESDGGCCCDCDCKDGELDGGDSSEQGVIGPGPGSDYESRMEMDLESVRWAIDVGIWVLSFGVGYMLSKASAKSLRRLRIL